MRYINKSGQLPKLRRILLLSILTVAYPILAQAQLRGLASALSLCASLFSDEQFKATASLTQSGPVGKLTASTRTAGGSNGGRWYTDERGIYWFLKKDRKFPELQTSAEVVSSEIYRHLGYVAPETVIVEINGERYSASRELRDPEQTLATDLGNLNTTEVRQMRVVAAYLKDWDRLNQDNPLFSNGALAVLDFGGTLGARAMGDLKTDGAIFDNQIGSFQATNNLYVVYDDFKVEASKDHPWNHLNRRDAELIVEKFKRLTDADIERIVMRAKYSNAKDSDYMISALKLRRDAIVDGFLTRFPKIDKHPTADQIRLHLARKNFRDPLWDIQIALRKNYNNVRAQLRQTIHERVLRAQSLIPPADKFRYLSDQQLMQQWGGKLYLDLPSGPEFKYLSPITGLKRGDRVRVTRTVILPEADLRELLISRVYTSDFLHKFNYDLSLIESVYQNTGHVTLEDLLDYNIGNGGTFIPTTFALDGWGPTRADQPLIYNPNSKIFNLQVEFSIPVEAIVLITPGSHIPDHVTANPEGFGFVTETIANKESEISFWTVIHPDWITTDFNNLKKICTDIVRNEKPRN